MIAWGYDGLYRLTAETWTGPEARTYNYTYDVAGNRLTKVQDTTASGGSVTTTTSTYNDLNELLATDNGQLTTYSHDKNGNRISKTTGSDTINYTFDTSNRLIAADDGTDTIFEANV